MTLAETLERLDPQDMYAAIQAFPEHLAEGWNRGEAAEGFGLTATDFDGLVICGMGGSAIGGDLLRTLAEPEAPIPMQVVRGYDMPGWVGEKTLVVASSYSGGTEETLSAFGQARERGATIVVVASGGTLMGHAETDGLHCITIPGGLQPRAALGYSFGVLLRLGRALGLLTLSDEAIEVTLNGARERSERYAHVGPNPARELAEALNDRLPVIYSGVGLLEAVNLRWRTQIHENAKVPAVGNVFPELDHNEIMGFEGAPAEVAGHMAVVTLRDRDDHPQIQRRMDVTRRIIEPSVASWTEVQTEGEGRLARMLALVQLGDWTSFWMAMRRQVDPTPVESIQQLKRTLAET